MSLMQEVAESRRQGMEKAATLWETFENLPEPIDPINLFKVVCAVKCGEFLARIKDSPLFIRLTKTLTAFLDATLEIVGEKSGGSAEGLRVLAILDELMPLTAEVFDNALAYATRQHVYDGLILLAAAKMGKQEEVKECIEHLREAVAKSIVAAVLSAVDEPR